MPLSRGDRCPACDGVGRRAAGADRDPDEGVTVELVDAAIAKHDRAEQRRRLLPARLVVYFVLALCLFARESYEEVLRVVRFWISHGVKIFRVDNPHTKPPNFWAWLIGEVKNDDPDVLFLAEAFT